MSQKETAAPFSRFSGGKNDLARGQNALASLSLAPLPLGNRVFALFNVSVRSAVSKVS